MNEKDILTSLKNIQDSIDNICEDLINIPSTDVETFQLLVTLQNFENWLHRYQREVYNMFPKTDNIKLLKNND